MSVAVEPPVGCVPAGGQIVLDVTCMASQPGKLDASFDVRVRGQGAVSVAVAGQVGLRAWLYLLQSSLRSRLSMSSASHFCLAACTVEHMPGCPFCSPTMGVLMLW